MLVQLLTASGGVQSSSNAQLRWYAGDFDGTYGVRVELRSPSDVLLGVILDQQDEPFTAWHGNINEQGLNAGGIIVELPSNFGDGAYKLVVRLSGTWSEAYGGSPGWTNQGEVSFTLERQEESNWKPYAQRPPAAQGSNFPGVVAYVGGVLYYLHEEAPYPASSVTDTLPFYKFAGGAWVELTGPAALDAEEFAPVNEGDQFTGEWWRRAQAYNLGDGRIAFAGWVFHVDATYHEAQPDPYHLPVLIPDEIHVWCKRLVRVYDIGADTWTDYLDSVETACVGTPVVQTQYRNSPGLWPAISTPRFASITFVARDGDGLLWMASDQRYGGGATRTWDPATGNFAAASDQLILPWGVAYWRDVTQQRPEPYGLTYIGEVLADTGWFAWRGSNLEASRGTDWPSEVPPYVLRWDADADAWAGTTVTPRRSGPMPFATGCFWGTADQLAWTFCHNGDGATPTPYVVRGATVTGSEWLDWSIYGTSRFLVCRYLDEAPQELGLSGMNETLDAANVYASDAGVFLVTKSGVYKLAPSGDSTAPTVEITEPDEADTVSGAIAVTISTTDETALGTLRLYLTPAGGSQTLVGTATLSGKTASSALTVNTLLFADGAATLTAVCFDAAGNVATDTLGITIDNSTPPPDTTPPTLTITEPLDGDTVRDQIDVRATAHDDRSLASARLTIDGAQHGTDLALSGTAAEFGWEVDLSGWANGYHLITVTVWDGAGNQASATVGVTIDNLTADAELVLYTDELPSTSPAWRLAEGKRLASIKLDVITGAVPADPRQVYNVYPFWKAGAAGIDADYTAMIPFATRDVLPVEEGVEALRFALVARPSYRSSFWQVADAVEAFRFILAGTRQLVLTREPVRVYELAGAALTELVDLSSTPFAAAVLREPSWLDGKLLLGTDLGLIALDLDSGDQPAQLRFDASTYDTDGLAVRGSAAVLRQNGKLWSFTWPSSKLLAAAMPEGVLWSDGTTTIAASSGNGLYSLAAGSGEAYGNDWHLLYSAGSAVHRLFRDPDAGSSTLDLWVGCAGSILRAQPTWQVDSAIAGTVLAFAKWRGYLWAAGQVGGLWRRTPSGWELYDALADVAKVNDMTVIDDRLYLAVEFDDDGTSRARVIRLQVDFGGDFRCGPTPPDVLPRAIDYFDVEVQ